MLLYHFPLTSNSTTANLENRGMLQDYTIGGVGAFISGGKMSSYCLSQSTSGTTFTIPTFTNNYSLCLRAYITTNANICTIGGTAILSSLVGITNAWCDIIIQGGKLYVNGSYKSALTYSNGTLVIGGSYSGRLQDLRIYDYCLSPQEIADYSKALVLHYTLNGSVNDCSGIGTQTTSVDITTNSNSMRGSHSAQFNGSTSYIRCSDAISNNTTAFSFSFWLNATIKTSCIWAGRSATGAVGIFVYSSTIRFDDASDSLTKATTILQANTWYHIVCTWSNGGKKRIYINGELDTEVDASTLSKTNTLATIGRTSSNDGSIGGSQLNGLLSDFRLYMSELSSADILALYNTPITLGASMNVCELVENETETETIQLFKSGVIKADTINEGSNQLSKNGISYTRIKEL